MEITIKEVFQILKRNIVFILVSTIAVTAVTFCVTQFFVPKKYISSVKLYVETDTGDSGSALGNNNDRNYAVALVNTYKEMLQTNRFYTQVSADIGGKYTSTQLATMISFTPLNETEVFQASVSAPYAEDAKQIADSVAKIAPQMINKLKENAVLKIVDEAQLPTKHSSPKVLQITLAAFFIALVLSSVIAVLRRILDTRIVYNEEMNTLLGVTVLATVPSFDQLGDSKEGDE